MCSASQSEPVPAEANQLGTSGASQTDMVLLGLLRFVDDPSNY